jgi:hypothetical protein
MSNDLTRAGDGFDVPERGGGNLIIGKLLKFNSGAYTADKTEPVPIGTTLAAVSVTTAWVHWADGRPTEHRITLPGQTHPERDDLPDQDEDQWEEGLNGEPADPWRDTRYLQLIDPRTGADFTFVSDSYGGRRAVGELKSQIANVRFAHPGAVPIVQLSTTTMKTNYGPKPRPQFKVVSWKGGGGKAEPAPAMTQIEHQREPTKANAYDDEIPF